ncbi:putative protein phosphatase 2C T23F11.1 [Diplonema papillatum]|nr:putative protein phosphatase 2C T23F11.1 [Diplonema papillatum]
MGDNLSKPVLDKYSQQFDNAWYRVGASSMQGWRKGMEDAHTTELSLQQNQECAFYAVYDGHCGQKVAQYCGSNLHRRVAKSTHFSTGEYPKALEEGFLGTDEDLLKSEEMRNDGSGCTAVALLVTGKGQIYCANAGDSRCVLCRGGQAVPMSFDHKPTNDEEMKRIQKAGAYVNGGRVNGNLSLSRAIGDFAFKQNPSVQARDQAITALPDVLEKQLQADDEFAVLACDGIWDCMTNEQVVAFVREELQHTDDLASICEKVFDNCVAPSAPNIGCDNMTMIIVQFKDDFKKKLSLLG